MEVTTHETGFVTILGQDPEAEDRVLIPKIALVFLSQTYIQQGQGQIFTGVLASQQECTQPRHRSFHSWLCLSLHAGLYSHRGLTLNTIKIEPPDMSLPHEDPFYFSHCAWEENTEACKPSFYKSFYTKAGWPCLLSLLSVQDLHLPQHSKRLSSRDSQKLLKKGKLCFQCQQDATHVSLLKPLIRQNMAPSTTCLGIPGSWFRMLILGSHSRLFHCHTQGAASWARGWSAVLLLLLIPFFHLGSLC